MLARLPKLATTLDQPVQHDRYVRGQGRRIEALFGLARKLEHQGPLVVLTPSIPGLITLEVHRAGATVHHDTLVMS